MATRNPLLDGVCAKIERAGNHILEFYDASQTFLNSRPISFNREEDSHTKKVYVTVTDIKPTPTELSVIIGDAVHNLRSALDLLVCQLIQLQVGTHNCKGVFFPIAESSQQFELALKKDSMPKLGKSVIEILKRMQPYMGGSFEELWLLHRLDIQDKHRLLIVAPTVIQRWKGKTLFIPKDTSFEEPRFTETTSVLPDGVLYVPKVGDRITDIDPDIISDGLEGEVYAHFLFRGDLAFDEPGILKRESVQVTLAAFFKIVQDAVNQFALFFPEIS